MTPGQTRLLWFSLAFLATEVFFNYVMLATGDATLAELSVKTLTFLIFILLFSKKLAWAKWLLSIGLIVYGLMNLIVGFELMAAFYVVGAFDIYFGSQLLTSKTLAEFRTVRPKSPSPEIAPIWAAENTTPTNRPTYRYPLLIRRIKAILVDSVLLMTVLIIIMITVEDSTHRTSIMVASAAIILLTYEPLLTYHSRTLGQRWMGIRVRRYGNPDARIGLLSAYIRWITKGLLGWVSFVTIHFNPERRAIHDLASRTVMVCDE